MTTLLVCPSSRVLPAGPSILVWVLAILLNSALHQPAWAGEDPESELAVAGQQGVCEKTAAGEGTCAPAVNKPEAASPPVDTLEATSPPGPPPASAGEPPAQRPATKQAVPQEAELVVGSLEWTKLWAARGDQQKASPDAAPNLEPQPVVPEEDPLFFDYRLPWGEVLQAKSRARLGEPHRVWLHFVKGDLVAGRDYYRRLCKRIPKDAESLIMREGLREEWFKPVEGSNICNMLTSNHQHLWSLDGQNWVAPPYINNPEDPLLGGSELLTGDWLERTGGRDRLFSWGHEWLPGGGFGRSFHLFVSGPLQSDLAQALDILMSKQAVPFGGNLPALEWVKGLPFWIVNVLGNAAISSPNPVHRRWAVPAHKFSRGVAQCLDFRTAVATTIGSEWMGPMSLACCDELGQPSVPVCEEWIVWKDAGTRCGEFDLRLCTRKELEGKVKSPGSCLFDDRLFWTVDECDGPVQCEETGIHVNRDTFADLAFWEEKCRDLPAHTEFVRVQMGSIVEYFKPSFGYSLCDMLTSGERHFWSAEGTEWFPLAKSQQGLMLGGSSHKWTEYVILSSGGISYEDNRATVSIWGHAEAQKVNLSGGCCNGLRAAPDGPLRFGLPFVLTGCRSDPTALFGSLDGVDPQGKAASSRGEIKCEETESSLVDSVSDSDITATAYNEGITRALPGYAARSRLGNQQEPWRQTSPHDWVQWDFGREVLVTAVLVKGRTDDYEWVRTFTLSYLTSSGEERFIPQVFTGSADRDTLVQRRIDPPVLAWSMRLFPTTVERGGSLRADFLGCAAPPAAVASLATGPAEELQPERTGCPRPTSFCTGEDYTYMELDCDGDGIPDPFCRDRRGSSGFLGSAQGCENTWPSGSCGGACPKPADWCPHGLYSEIDCDGDGVRDPYCQEENPPRTTFLSSASNCSNESHCPRTCLKPEGFCYEAPFAATLTYQDCDLDGIPDQVCTDKESSRSGYVSSKNGCFNSWPFGGCKGSCKRPNGWCKSWQGKFDDSQDLDGDGIPDPSCIAEHTPDHIRRAKRLYSLFGLNPLKDLSGSGFISSRNGCLSTRYVGGKCRPPPGWCTHPGSMYFETDCDGDGIIDAACQDSHSSGVISSAFDCANSWPKGGCNDRFRLAKIFLKKMECKRNGAFCKCASDWCLLGPRRVDLDADSIPDHQLTVPLSLPEDRMCGQIASGRRCLDTFPNCVQELSPGMVLLVGLKTLQCELWSTGEIIFLTLSFIGFLFAYGICECPRRCLCRARKPA